MGNIFCYYREEMHYKNASKRYSALFKELQRAFVQQKPITKPNINGDTIEIGRHHQKLLS